MNKTFWYRHTFLKTFDSEKERENSILENEVTLGKRFSKVKIVDVVAPFGKYSSWAVSFICENEKGEQGFVNVSQFSWRKDENEKCTMDKFCYLFFEKDPREIFIWSDTVWKAIESEKPILGMTMEQVLMAIDDPFDESETISTNGRVQIWYYKNPIHRNRINFRENYYGFNNGVLVLIKD